MRPFVPFEICLVAILVAKAPLKNAFRISFEDADHLSCHCCSSFKGMGLPSSRAAAALSHYLLGLSKGEHQNNCDSQAQQAQDLQKSPKYFFVGS